MFKFYRIASNNLQAIQIVHELFDCPSYIILKANNYAFWDRLWYKNMSEIKKNINW